MRYKLKIKACAERDKRKHWKAILELLFILHKRGYNTLEAINNFTGDVEGNT